MDQISIQQWLAARVAKELGLPESEIDVSQPVGAFGLQSHTILAITVDLEEKLDTPLSERLFFEHPTLEAASAEIARLVERQAETAQDAAK